MIMPNVSPSDAHDPPAAPGRPGGPPAGQIVDWVKFAVANLSQVHGFLPKVKAVGRLIAVLLKR